MNGLNWLRRTLLALLLAALLPAAAASQLMLSVNGGFTFATLEGDDVEEEWGDATGYMAGASLGLPFTEMISISPGLYWIQKGAEGAFPDVLGDVDLDFETSWLEIPVLALFRVTAPDRPLGVSVFLGPEIAFEMSCTIEAEADGEQVDSADCDEDSDLDDREKMDFGAIFGAGLSFPFGTSAALLLNGGLDLGFKSLGAGDDDVKNSMWFVTAGVGLPLGGG